MAFSERHRRQVELVIRVLPFVGEEHSFALKGGTAINLFIRNMPRLSVDIDLTYLPIAARAESLAAIDLAMKRIAERTSRALAAKVTQGTTRPEGAVTRLLIRVGDVQTKIEVTPVLRGCVYDPQIRRVTGDVEKTFGFAEARVVSFADLYGGKIVAALDRQHPRDLFDVRDLLANEGLDEALRRAFLIYLVSHNRPMCEVLAPKKKTIGREYRRSFKGMTAKPVTVAQLMAARESLIDAAVTKMPEAHQRFLLSFERGEPDWAIFGLAYLPNLPAVRWRQQNLAVIGDVKRARLVAKLEKVWSKGGKMRVGSREG